MAAPTQRRSPLGVWALVITGLTLASGCGRVGYDRVVVVDAAPTDRQEAPGQGGGDVAVEVAPAPDLGPADVAPADVRPPDVLPDAAPEAPPPVDVAGDRPLDQAPPPDAADPTPVPPVFAGARSAAGAGNDQLSFMHDAGNGRNRYLVVGIALETEVRNVTAVSFGGRALTRLGAEVRGACGSFLYGLANPPAGNNPLVVSLNDTSDMVVVASSFTGVRQTASQGTFVSGASLEAPIALVVPSAAGDYVVDNLCLDDGNSGVSAGPGQIERGRRTASSFEAAMSSEPGAPSVTMSWSFSGASIPWASAAVSLKPAAAMAIRLERRQTFAFRSPRYTNRPGRGPVVRVPKLSAPPPNRL